MDQKIDRAQGPGPVGAALAEGWGQFRARARAAWDRLSLSLRGDRAVASSRRDPAPPFPASGWGVMACDVFSDKQRVLVRLAAPGMRREDFDVALRHGRLTIEGPAARGGARQAHGRFFQAVALPGPVMPDHVRASYRDGVLEVEVLRPPRAGRRRIEVSAA